MQLSVIILNYNGLSHLEPCLTSLARIAYPSAQLEIIIVDNASTDGSANHIERQYPQVRLIRSATNLGFSQGACLVAEFAARHPQRYGGVIVLSGSIIENGDKERARSLAKKLLAAWSTLDVEVPWIDELREMAK